MSMITTMSSREFNQDISRAKKAANEGPVFITDRGEPAHVLLSIDAYRHLTGKEMTLAEALAQPGGPESDFEVEMPRSRELPRPAEFK
jgi:prevent-host-death family protein